MHKIAAVEEAKALMNEARDWSLWRWLLDKGRVRAAADRAVDALAEAEKRVKAAWDDDLKNAYSEFEAQAAFERNSRARQRYEKAKAAAKGVDPELKLTVQKVKVADDEAEKARLEAEATFAEAERQLSASLAREAAQQAIESWDLRLKAIRKAEALSARG